MIGKRIRDLRRWKGISQEELCRGICHRSLLSKVENGATMPSYILLCELAERLGVELNFILADVNDDTENNTMLEFMTNLLSDNDYDSVVKYGKKIMNLKQMRDSEMHLGECHRLMGLAYHAMGNYTAAKIQFTVAVEKSKNNNLGKHISCLNSLAASLINLGEYDDALCHLETIQELGRLFSVDVRTRIRTMFNTAKIHRKFGRSKEAKRDIQNGLSYCRQEGILESSGHFETLLGLIYLDEQSLTDAVQCFERARLFYTYINDIEGEIGSYLNLAEATIANGDCVEALHYATIARSLWSNHSSSLPESCIADVFIKLNER